MLGIFLKEDKQPDEKDLRKALGSSYGFIEMIIEFFKSEYSDISYEWRFYKKSGWFLFYVVKKLTD